MVKSKRLLYFAYSFVSDHITTDNYYYLRLLHKTKIQLKLNTKQKIMQNKKVQYKMENNEF